MAGFPITINSLSGNGVVNVGGAFSISPLTVSKTVYGSGGGNTGMVLQMNQSSTSQSSSSQYSAQNVTKTL
ncbi:MULTISPECIES: spore germination protein [Bacillus amyloliquefaciens group]|nr:MULTISPECIES: spore germination protein [Bacillus amyloliquefaciens group]MBG9464979.1 spore gernimation protein [Bacillus amyloliquefaciens]MEB3987991.1 spore germination protein [Bacillus velezensis]UFK58929.1 spore germination protein [Bacillus amyloliquefaciens]